jgi:hypothetical protein
LGVIAKKEGGLVARGEQGFAGVAAEIVQGKSLRPLLADLAKLPGVGLLAVTQDDDACRRGGRGVSEGGEQKREDEANHHGADTSRSIPPSPLTSG